MRKRLVMGMVVLILIAAPLCSLSAAGKVESPAASSGLDGNGRPSEYVKLKMVLLGNGPADENVLKELNKILLEDLNTELDVRWLTWADYKNKYNLILTSGETVDLMYTAFWMNYADYAKKGAYRPLDELLESYAPDIMASMDEFKWGQIRVDGSIYAVPADEYIYTNVGFYYREDLRKKYGCPEIVDLETIEIFLDAVKKNEKDMFPLSNVNGQIGTRILDMASYQGIGYDTAGKYLGFFMDTPDQLFNVFETEEFMQYMKLMKEWGDKGYWSRNSLSEKIASRDAVRIGKAAACFVGNFDAAKGAIQEAKEDPARKGWDYNVVPYGFLNKRAVIAPATTDAMAIPINAKYPERAMMVLNKLQSDVRCNRLSRYGIENKHYRITDGKLDMRGINPEETGSNVAVFGGWGWRNQDFELTAYDAWDQEEKWKNLLKQYVVDNPYVAAPFDTTNIQAEIAALQQVEIQYGYPLYVGLVEDVEKGVADLIARMKEAGLDAYTADYQRQAREYLAMMAK